MPEVMFSRAQSCSYVEESKLFCRLHQDTRNTMDNLLAMISPALHTSLSLHNPLLSSRLYVLLVENVECELTHPQPIPIYASLARMADRQGMHVAEN